MTGRSSRVIVAATALLAAMVGLDVIGHAAAATGRSRSSSAPRALEPGFIGTYLYRNRNFRTGQNLAESIDNNQLSADRAGTGTPTATKIASSTSTPTVSPAPTSSPTPPSTPSHVFATLQVSPSSISFSSQAIGHASKAATVTVRNTASVNSVIMSEPTVSSGFMITSNNCPTVLRPGATCRIGVASVPKVKGKQTGQLRLNSNAEFGTRSINLKGEGVAPKVKANPKSLSFERVAPEAVSSSHSVTIVNDTPKPVSFTTAPAATPPFNVTANTCGTLAPNGGTCTVSVEFAPHARGRYVGTLELRDTAANSPQHVKLFGNSK